MSTRNEANISPIALDALAAALERGESIDDDSHRETVAAIYTSYLTGPPDPPDPEDDEDPDPVQLKSFANLPRL